MESEQVNGTIEHAKKSPEAECEDSKIHVETKSRDSSASSSSSSRLSLDLNLSEESPLGDNSLCRGESLSSPKTPQWSMLSASSPVGIEDHLSQMKSPPVQKMAQPAGYDPNRIPSSVFSTKPSNTSDWSVASNDSLFSIHMGNNSFSKDYMYGKSGELSRIDEWNNSQSVIAFEAKHSNELSGLPTVMEVAANEECSVKSSKVSSVDKEDFNNSPKIVPEPTKEALPSNARLSNESGCSSSSFAFPVLVNDGGKAGSLKGVEEKPEEPQLQNQDSKETDQKSSESKWFCWFSCLPRCC